jgi:hypothetical protein
MHVSVSVSDSDANTQHTSSSADNARGRSDATRRVHALGQNRQVTHLALQGREETAEVLVVALDASRRQDTLDVSRARRGVAAQNQQQVSSQMTHLQSSATTATMTDVQRRHTHRKAALKACTRQQQYHNKQYNCDADTLRCPTCIAGAEGRCMHHRAASTRRTRHNTTTQRQHTERSETILLERQQSAGAQRALWRRVRQSPGPTPHHSTASIAATHRSNHNTAGQRQCAMPRASALSVECARARRRGRTFSAENRRNLQVP